MKLWRVAKHRFDCRIRGRHLRRLMKKAGNTDCFTLNKAETLIREAAAKAALEDLKPKAGQYRLEHLQQLAEALALSKDADDAASEFKKLTNQELQRKTGFKLRATSKKGSKGLATKLMVGPKGDKTAVEDKEGLDQVGADENKGRSSSCTETCECLHDQQLVQDVGMLADGSAVDDILQGQYHIPEHLSKGTKTILEFMPMPHSRDL